MTPRISLPSLKSAGIGALAGALVFLGLSAVKAQTALTVAAVESNAKAYVGTTVAVTGLVSNVRTDSRSVNGAQVPYVKLNLYKVDSKGRKQSRYIYVALPASAFQTMPIEGQLMEISGPLKWGYEIAAIDP
jgi:hypothetical protein